VSPFVNGLSGGSRVIGVKGVVSSRQLHSPPRAAQSSWHLVIRFNNHFRHVFRDHCRRLHWGFRGEARFRATNSVSSAASLH